MRSETKKEDLGTRPGIGTDASSERHAGYLGGHRSLPPGVEPHDGRRSAIWVTRQDLRDAMDPGRMDAGRETSAKGFVKTLRDLADAVDQDVYDARNRKTGRTVQGLEGMALLESTFGGTPARRLHLDTDRLIEFARWMSDVDVEALGRSSRDRDPGTTTIGLETAAKPARAAPTFGRRRSDGVGRA